MTKKIQNSTILILSAEGMLGQYVFAYLKSVFSHTFGTTRKKNNSEHFIFSVENAEKDFYLIQKKLKKIDYVINCIGVLRNYNSLEQLISTNALFPHRLEKLAETYLFRVFHISTDMVYSPLVHRVTESSTPSAFEMYGASKLLGETTHTNALTIRTSIVGFDRVHHRGLLEWVLQNNSTRIKGFINQLWTGCTTLQYAMLCKKIIEQNAFDSLRKKSPVFHFTPIEPTSKYLLIKDFLTIMKLKKNLEKAQGEKITRILASNFTKELYVNEFKRNDIDALKELIEFEKIRI